MTKWLSTPISFAILAALITEVWLVQYVHLVIAGSAFSQYLSLALLACTIAAAVRKCAPSCYSHALAAAIVLFSLMWGRVIFCGYLYYDELNRITSFPPLAKALVTPINDHLTPVMYLLWWLQYKIFCGAYWVIGLSHYISGLFMVAGVVKIIEASVERRSQAHLMGVLFASLSALSPRIWLWKGCGDSPVLSLWLFFLLYYLCIKSNGRPSRAAVGGLAALYATLTFSCSAITLGVLFLLPFLLLRQFRTGRFVSLLALFSVISAGYWLLRLSIVHETRPHFIGDIPGAFLTVWGTYSGGRTVDMWTLVATAVVLFLAALSGPALALYRKEYQPLAVWTTGLFMFALGTLQLWGARDLTLDLRTELTRYHMFLPYAGISLMVGASIASWRIPSTAVGYLLVLVLAGHFLYSTAEFSGEAIPRHQGVLQARAEFFRDLDQLVQTGVPVPDRSIVDAPYRLRTRLDFTEISLLRDSEKIARYHMREAFSLSRLTYVFLRKELNALPCDTPYSQLQLPAARFMEKYWPSQPQTIASREVR